MKSKRPATMHFQTVKVYEDCKSTITGLIAYNKRGSKIFESSCNEYNINDLLSRLKKMGFVKVRTCFSSVSIYERQNQTT